MNIIFFDTETTGGEAKDRIIQLGVKSRGVEAPVYNNLYKPEVPISIESMAIHHIVPEMVEHKPVFTAAPEYKDIKNLFENHETFAVAHNSSFDVGMLAKEGVHPVNVICTLKVARALDTEEKIPKFGLQYLRYFLKLRINGVVPHDAWGDVVVLEHVFERLFKKMVELHGSEEAALSRMVSITRNPSLMKTIRFGKHNGKRIEDLVKEDRGYLEWLLREKEKAPLGEEDWIYSLKVALGQIDFTPREVPSKVVEKKSAPVAADDIMSHFKPASSFSAPKATEKTEEDLPVIVIE